MDWEECKIKRYVKESLQDVDLINSLVNQSNKKIITDDFSPLNKDTSSTKFVNNYDSLREVLEAIAIKKGFKIYNHECFTAFLKEFMDLDSESIDFDNFRKIRNSINYYGEDITIEDAESLISKIRLLRKKLIKEFL